MHKLFEANLANSSDTSIKIINKKGELIEVINSFNAIFDRMIRTSVKQSTSDEKILTWFNSNFKNWMKNEAPGYDDHGKYLDEKRFYSLFYPDLDSTVDAINEDNPELSHDEIKAMFPDYIKKNPAGVTIFSAGRMFRFKNSKFMSMMGELVDYLKTVVDNQENRNVELLPDRFFVKDLTKVTPNDALRNTIEYHNYFERMQSKLEKEKILQNYRMLKQGKDYEVLETFSDGSKMMKALSSAYTNCEGGAMGHCVATYGKDVDSKKIVILSFSGPDGLPQATIEVTPDMKLIKQLKGKRNGPVAPEYHKNIQKFIKDNEMKFSSAGYGSSDYRNIGLKTGDYKDIKIEENAFSRIKFALLEATYTSTKSDIKFDPFTKTSKQELSKNDTRSPAKVNLKTTSVEKTREKMKDVKMDKMSFLHFLTMNLDDEDEISDEVAQANVGLDITKPKSTTLPVVINTSLRAVGEQEPEFHMVKNLPGYMVSGIRAVGRKVFEPFTKTKIEDIQVIANLNNSGPNSSLEINSVAAFLKKYGTRNSKYEISFFDKIPGYEADALIYTYANFTFLLVKDHAGDYIYAWPSTDNKNNLEDKSIDNLLK